MKIPPVGVKGSKEKIVASRIPPGDKPIIWTCFRT
jgi:hypothetical protein